MTHVYHQSLAVAPLPNIARARYLIPQMAKLDAIYTKMAKLYTIYMKLVNSPSSMEGGFEQWSSREVLGWHLLGSWMARDLSNGWLAMERGKQNYRGLLVLFEGLVELEARWVGMAAVGCSSMGWCWGKVALRASGRPIYSGESLGRRDTTSRIQSPTESEIDS
jgi:hypothetical protein